MIMPWTERRGKMGFTGRLRCCIDQTLLAIVITLENLPMEAGVTDHVWSIEDIARLAD